mgnify:CR=1 FL=1
MNNISRNRYQLWPQMILVLVVLFFGMSYVYANFIYNAFPLMAEISFYDELVWLIENNWHEYYRWLISEKLMVPFYIKILAPVLLIFILSITITWWLLWISGGRSRELHLSGSQLFIDKLAYRHARTLLKSELSKNKRTVKGICLHLKIAITSQRESGNIFIVGQQGSGKTQIILHLLQQITTRDCRLFIYDEKKEFTELFFNPATSHLIAPWDHRSSQWNISLDIQTIEEAELFSEQALPVSSSEKEPQWTISAQTILAGILVYLMQQGKPWGWCEISQMLGLCDIENPKLKELLGEVYPSAANLIAEGNKTTFSIYSKLSPNLRWVHTLARAWPKSSEHSFSIKSWLEGSTKKQIIVQSDEQYRTVGKPLCNTLFAMMASKMQSQGNVKSKETWLVLDELANLPKSEMLQKWFSVGRSLGCRTISGLQSYSQLREIYGDNLSRAMSTMQGNVIALQHGAGEDATIMSERLGMEQMEVPHHTLGAQGQFKTEWKKEQPRLIVTPDDLSNLPSADDKGVHGYLKIYGYHATYKLMWPHPAVETIAIPTNRARWTQSGNKNKKKSPLVSNRLNKRVKDANH